MNVFAVNSDGTLRRLSLNERNKIIVSATQEDDEWMEEIHRFAGELHFETRFEDDGWYTDMTIRIKPGAHFGEKIKKYLEGDKSDFTIFDEWATGIMTRHFPNFKRGDIKLEYVEGEGSSLDGSALEDIMDVSSADEVVDESQQSTEEDSEYADEDDGYDFFDDDDIDIPMHPQIPVTQKPVAQPGTGRDQGDSGDSGGGSGGGGQRDVTRPTVNTPTRERDTRE